jgi:2-amino-4-hydroxy-6-hydroxymethyldihydropteridine diphosphokinase
VILIGIGANLKSPLGEPLETCRAAIAELPRNCIFPERVSGWYSSPAHPPSAQPEFVNAVISVTTGLSPADLLGAMNRIETRFGRVRTVANAARSLDLDLLDYDGRIEAGPPVLPHPRMHLRRFVLDPLAEVAAHWRHPIQGLSIPEMIAEIAEDQGVRRL